MIEVHLYGKLRRFSGDLDPTSASIAWVESLPGDTVLAIVDRLGIPHEDLGSNKFLNGKYADMRTLVNDGDRLGLFPDDMQLLYKWYFAPTQSDVSGDPNKSPTAPKPKQDNPDSNSQTGHGAKSES